MRIAFDTNILVYAHDDRELRKQEQALGILRRLQTADTHVALQVIGEFQNVLRRKLHVPAPEIVAIAQDILGGFATFAYSSGNVLEALAEFSTGRFSYWDALLLSACATAGVEVLFSEDMQDGLVFGGVEIVNPFGADGLSPRAQQIFQVLEI